MIQAISLSKLLVQVSSHYLANWSWHSESTIIRQLLTPVTENNVGDPLSKTQADTHKSNNGPSIVDMLSRTKTKEEIANQKKARAQSISKVKPNEPEKPVAQPVTQSIETPIQKPVEAQAPRGRDPAESATTSTAMPTPTATTTATTTAAKPASAKPKHPDDDRPSMALAPKCMYPCFYSSLDYHPSSTLSPAVPTKRTNTSSSNKGAGT